MFKQRLQRGEGELHRCIEGERVGVDGGEVVGVDRRRDGCPGGILAPPGEKGREPPSFFFLGLPLDGRRVPPLVHGRHGGGGVGAPPRLDLPLCSLLFHVPVFWPKTVSYIPGDP